MAKSILRRYAKKWPIFKEIYCRIDAARQERDVALAERNAALFEREAALVERDAARAEHGAALVERDAALVVRDAALVERDAASAEVAVLKRVPLFVPPGHFYSPVVDPASARRKFARLAEQPYPAALPGLVIRHSHMVATWRRLLPYLRSNPFSAEAQPELRYCYENQNYSYGDGVVLHAMLRHYRPNRVVEIGSGWSSACALDTIEIYFDQPCAITFIEPYPELLKTLINGSRVPCTILEHGVQDTPPLVFSELEAGDILFIDSTHIMATGSDVCFELFEIVPNLKSGVLIHFHDVFWPFEYPARWAIEENRSWNELYGLLAFLMYNKNYKIIFFNDYFAKSERELIEQTFPLFGRNSGGALWLVKQ